MQDIVQYLLDNPDVVEKAMNGEVSILGVSLEELPSLIEGLFNATKTVAHYWW
ncbi:competence pheromone ComX [Metabacillus sp. 84]|uniref:competence pheromone ComX n=1 Tax=unclassified Metabacillus TaxID=2675274 RepID=UPI003CEE4F9F